MIAVYIDVESTGLSPRFAAVVEIGAVASSGDEVLSEFRSLCNPGAGAMMHPSVDDALKVNGLTRHEIHTARPISEVAADFREWLAVQGPSTLHAYNNQFDAGFLTESPWKLNPLSWGQCVMKAVAGGRRWCKLKDAASRFGLQWDGDAHRALADARMAFKVHRAYLKHNGLVRV